MTSKLRGQLLQKIRERKSLKVLSSLSFPLSWFLVFFLVPAGIMFVYSFWRQVYLSIQPTLTIVNYVQFFSNPMFVRLLMKSIGISVVVTIGAISIGYPVAYFLAMKVKRHKMTLVLLLMGPFWTSYLLIVFAWKLILGYDGVLNSLLLYVGLIHEPLKMLLFSPYAVMIALIHIWSPWLILPMFVSLEKMDKSLLEAALDLGATPFRAFLRVTLPLSMPGLIVAVLFVFIPTVGEFVTPMLVGGPEGVMFGNIIDGYFHAAMNWPLGSALSFVMLGIVLVVVSLLLRRVGPERVMESL